MAEPALKTNKQGDIIVFPGIALARNKDRCGVQVAHFKAVQEFGQRMLDSRELFRLLENNDNLQPFLDIVFEYSGLHLRDLVLAPNEPLGSFLKNGKFTYSCSYHDEQRQIIIDETRLRQAGIDLDMEKPFLVIKGGYSIHHENWWSFTVDFPKEIGNLSPFLDFRQGRGKDGWFNGASPRIASGFGPVRLEASLPFPGLFHGHIVYVGGRFAVSRAVLYRDDSQ